MNSLYNLYEPLIFILYALGCRGLLYAFIDAERKWIKLLSGIGIWGLFTLGEIFFIDWSGRNFMGLETLTSEMLTSIAVMILTWNLAWLFIIIMYSFMKKKRGLTKMQETILKDL